MYNFIKDNEIDIDINHDEKDNVSILMYACIYADIRLIDLIVTEKNINLKDKNGKNFGGVLGYLFTFIYLLYHNSNDIK